MSETSPRQVLYALVAGGFVLVVVVLLIGAAAVGFAPVWWSATLAFMAGIAAIWMARNWRRTALTIGVAIGLFLVWMVGTLIVAGGRSM